MSVPRFFGLCCYWILFIMLMAASNTIAKSNTQKETAQTISTTPRAKPDGSLWRIGYFQGGDYKNYVPVLEAIVSGLKKYGWINNIPDICFTDGISGEQAWRCLSEATSSRFITFAPDAFWDAKWDNTLRHECKRNAIDRLANAKDIDLIIAMGTWAGLDLANNEHHTPVIVASCSNALDTGIIKSVGDSGYDHVHARIDPTRYARQVKLFHRIFPFKRLGIVYEDSPEGRSYAGLDQIEPLTDQLEFTLVPCLAPASEVDDETARRAVLHCHQLLSPNVDAFYLTTHRGVTTQNINTLLTPFFQYNIPVFSMGTQYEVAHGALLSMTAPDLSFTSDFYARTIANIFNGAKPRDLVQLLEDPYKLSVNIETAKRIGFHIPLDVLSETDEIYEAIEQDEGVVERYPPDF
ncbi:ABC transporter substrate-binding protein [Desulfovibrio inopinatus]|uniref:ABC transporter substrate-binding protein n=1 Tax=Desulfovibrio inopinatus TaxID=102109 RepID=UPI0004134B87|nr:ABC transporter substrate binding protein [Desulfovibrio inopinatus]